MTCARERPVTLFRKRRIRPLSAFPRRGVVEPLQGLGHERVGLGPGSASAARARVRGWEAAIILIPSRKELPLNLVQGLHLRRLGVELHDLILRCGSGTQPVP